MNTLRVSMFAAAIAVFAVGCSSTSTDQKPAPVTDAQPAPAPTPAPPPPAAAPVKSMDTMSTPMDPLNVPGSLLSKRSVYFAFDRSSINESDVPVVEAHGRYLVDHTGRSVRIEGNCDERGGREYNLALGQRRADSVKQRLVVLGVSASRIETTSLGKEKPRNPGHDEAAWAENRRADIIYK